MKPKLYLLVVLLSTTITFGASNAPPPSTQQTQTETSTETEMQTMARSMTAMADMCRMMMEKEMTSRPIKIVALYTLGGLGTIALILFVILEVQWIRWWALKIKAVKRASIPLE